MLLLSLPAIPLHIRNLIIAAGHRLSFASGLDSAVSLKGGPLDCDLLLRTCQLRRCPR